MSQNNQATDPALALTLNPFNSEAAVNLVVGSLNGESVPDLKNLADLARGMISASPGDARGYSILGAVEERMGDRSRAQALYSVALNHSKSELHALLRTAQTRLEEADTAGALENIDLLLRRWPSYWQEVQPVLLAIASNKGTAAFLEKKLNELPPWRSRAIAALSKDPATLGTLRNLIASSPPKQRNSQSWRGERDGVIAALIANQDIMEAYSLFLSTLTDEEERVAGYVFDGRFELPLGRGYFGWRVQKPGATDITTGRRSDTAQTGLRVRFLDSPARPGVVTQNLMLPFGQYRLAVVASAAGLTAPKELYWAIRCEKGPVIGRLPVPTGSFTNSLLELNLEVPTSGCDRQILSLDTDVRTDSWRDRYQGEVRFSDLALTRL